MVVREIDETNRRQNKISLTSKGKTVLNDSIEILDKWESEVLKNCSDEYKLLNESLKKVFINTIELNMEANNE